MTSNLNVNDIRALLAQIKTYIAQLEAAIEDNGVVFPGEPPVAVDPVEPLTPLARDAAGKEYAPAWVACNALWNAAQREGVFSMVNFVGGGIKPGAAHLSEASPVTQREVEDKIVELGLSDWGRGWMAHDVNAQYIGAPYCYLFTEARGGKPALDPDYPRGYSVHRVAQHDESQGFFRKARPA